MEQNPSWKDNDYSTSQETPCLLWYPKVHYCVHKGSPLVLIIRQMNPVNTLTSYLPKIHSNIMFPSTSWSFKWFFPSGFLIKILSAFIISSMHARCPSHPTWSHHSNNIWWSIQFMGSSLCILFQPPVPPSLIGLKILLSNLFSNTLNLSFSLAWGQVTHPYKTTGISMILCILTLKFLERWWEDKRFWTEW